MRSLEIGTMRDLMYVADVGGVLLQLVGVVLVVLKIVVIYKTKNYLASWSQKLND